MADEQVAVPSTVSIESTIPVMTSEERSNWAKTGVLPEQAKPEEKSPDKEATPTSDTAKAPESAKAPEAEAGKKPSQGEEEPPEKVRVRAEGAERRIGQLTAQLREVQERLDAALKAAPPAKVEEPAKSAARVHPKGVPEPQLEDFDTYEDWVDAKSTWNTDVQVAAALKEEREGRAREAKEKEAKESEREAHERWTGRVAEFSKGHTDFAEKTTDSPIVQRILKEMPLISGWIGASEVGPELLYHFVSDEKELERFSGLNPFQTSRELVKLELKLSPNGQEPRPPKKVSAAPKPPTQLAAGATAPTDEALAALQAGDVRGYMEAKNRQELASRRR
mgnify:CR=1 FL=1